MELKIREDGINSYEQVMLIYRAALKQMNTRLEILSEEFQQRASGSSAPLHPIFIIWLRSSAASGTWRSF